MCTSAQFFALITAGCLILNGPIHVGAYNILGIFPTMSRSHHICGSGLMRGLAEAGHNVTMISPFRLTDKLPDNYREITILGVFERMKEIGPDILAMNHLNPFFAQWTLHDLGYQMTNTTLSHPVMRKFLNDPNEHFDVIICEISLNDAMIGLGHHFNAPVIGYSTFGASLWTNDLVGTPTPLSYVPHPFLSFTDRMSFAQRVANVLMTAYESLAYYSHLHAQADLYDRLFPGTSKPPLSALRRNVSLVLLNTHHTLGTPRPYAPNMIEIGGAHINRAAARPLPTQMREFVEGATHGCIYFSLGTNIRSADLKRPVRDGILRALGQLPQRVLWKWEVADLPGRPDNVMISPWLPQDDVLAHPNVRLFITHGGLLSTTEAVYHGVPLVGIPVFADQSLNMARAEANGFARTVQFTNLSEASLLWAVHEVLNNERYSRQAAAVSQRYRDQPLTPMQTAVYWVEYVVRHGCATHLHSAGQDLPVWVYHNVDVYAAIMAVLLALVWAGRWTVRRWALGFGMRKVPIVMVNGKNKKKKL